MDDQNGRLAAVTLNLVSAYGLLVKALMGLPLPIEIPMQIEDLWDGAIQETLARTTEILADIPMDDRDRRQVRGLVIDWIVASDVLFAAQEDCTDWRIDFVKVQIERMVLRNRLMIRDEPQE